MVKKIFCSEYFCKHKKSKCRIKIPPGERVKFTSEGIGDFNNTYLIKNKNVNIKFFHYLILLFFSIYKEF